MNHVDVVRALFLNAANEVLVMHRVYNGGAKWQMPGGAVDDGESLEFALTREIMEELNLEVVVNTSEIDAFDHDHYIGDVKGTATVHTYVVELTGEPIIAEPEKFSDMKWISVDEIMECPEIYVRGTVSSLTKYFGL